MFEVLKKRIKNEKGLSLVELLAVIVILGIVAAIAIPAIGNIINNQRDKAVLADISGLVSSAKIAFADGSCGTDNICQYGGATNEVDFSSEKVTGGTVSFANTPANPAITVTLDSGITFKGRNKDTFNDLIKDGFSESELNTVMGQ
ncbi:type II secretion system protein [Solibacillus ferritrahens]|uniref:type II secretion system protein n=1 Tax=Solibacillus ferritrahens TaxID=3098620 RepID=UPI003008FB72